MIIKKWIEYQKEIDISLSAEDICLLFDESDDPSNKMAIFLSNLNSLAQFLKGVPQYLIDSLSEKNKKTIFDFLSEQVNRYK